MSYCFFLYQGCPNPVVEVPQFSKPCPSNCEECYPDTGICMKCKLGFEGYACERGNYIFAIQDAITFNLYKIYSFYLTKAIFCSKKGSLRLFEAILLIFISRNITHLLLYFCYNKEHDTFF